MSDQILNINIQVGDRVLPLGVKASEEAIARRAALLLNDRIKRYESLHLKGDRIEIMAMVAFDALTLFLKGNEQRQLDDKDLVEKIRHMEDMVAGSLQT